MRYKIILLFILTSSLLQAQSFVAKADKYYKRGDMYLAASLFRDAIEKEEFSELEDKQRFRILYNYANSLRIIYDYEAALPFFQKISDSEYANEYPLSEYYLASCLKQLTKYELAKEKFISFLSKEYASKNNDIKLFAEQEIRSCEFAAKSIENPVKNIIINRLGDNVNTKFADFAPHFVGNFLYYSTMRFESMSERKRTDGDPQKKHLYSKIMRSEVKGLAQGVQLEQLNKRYKNVGNSALSTDGKRIYFAKGKKLKSANWQIVADLYVSEFNENRKKWKPAKKLPFNSKDGTNTQPHVSYDSTENAEVIFFSSTRKGGLGGYDIWKVYHYGNNIYSKAENLGEIINSQGDEMTPHFVQKSQTLHFSSNWHLNFGGFDIFSSKQSSGKWSDPVNLGIPVNSAANDFYYYVSPENDSLSFLSSNRIGSNILLGKSCCNDIYRLDLIKDLNIASELIATNDKSKDEIQNSGNSQKNDNENKNSNLLYTIVPEQYNSPENPYQLSETPPANLTNNQPYSEENPVYKAFIEADQIARMADDRKVYWDSGQLKPFVKPFEDNPIYIIVPKKYNSKENSYSLPNAVPNDPKTGQPYPVESPVYKAWEEANIIAEKSPERKLYWNNGKLESAEVAIEDIDFSEIELFKIQVAALKTLNKNKFIPLGQGKFSDLTVIYEQLSNGVTRVMLVPKVKNEDGTQGFNNKEIALDKLKLVVDNTNFKDAFIWLFKDNKRLENIILKLSN